MAFPSGVLPGDVLICAGHQVNAGAVMTVSGGGWAMWFGGNGLVAVRYAQADDASVTVTGNTGNMRTLLLVYRGGSVAGVWAGQINAGGSLVQCNTLQAMAGALFVGIGGLEGGVSRVFTYPAGATVRSERTTTMTLVAFDEPAEPSALTGLHPTRTIPYTGGDVINDRGSSLVIMPTGGSDRGPFKGAF